MKNLSHLEQRALAAYYRNGTRLTNTLGGSVMQPGSCNEIDHEGLVYVVLSNCNGVLAVYRVRNMADGSTMLKALKRWPKALNDIFGGA